MVFLLKRWVMNRRIKHLYLKKAINLSLEVLYLKEKKMN